MKFNTYDITDPAENKALREFIATRTLDALVSQLGPGFTAFTRTREIELKLGMGPWWRAVNVHVTKLDKLDLAIEKIKRDIITTNVRNFMRMEHILDQTTCVEKDGICLRVSVSHITGFAVIDWIAWK